MIKIISYVLLPVLLVAVGAFYFFGDYAHSSSRADLNLSETGLALRGYDPVAYFTLGEPTRGDEAIQARHDGALYYFSSEAHKQTFLQKPDAYLPVYGGFCAYGAAVNAKVDGDPELWHIVDGKLYLNINKSVDNKWKKDIPRYIEQADTNWVHLKKP